MKRYLFQSITAVVVATFIFGALSYTEAVANSDKPITLIQASWGPAKMPPPLDWDPFDFTTNEWMDTIERQTQGRVKFKRYPSETLIKVTDQWDAVTGGVCDIGLVGVPMVHGQFPMTAALRLPGFFENAIQGCVVRQELLEEGFLAREWKGAKVIWMANNAPWDISCRKKQIRTMEDLKGLKVASIGEPEISFIKALGAIPVGMPPTEFYIALERGTVDAAWMDINGQVAFNLYQKAPYITRLPGNSNGSNVTIMNQDKYNSLPADIKAIFDKNSGLLWSIIAGKRFDYNYDKCVLFLNERKDVPPVYVLPQEERARWYKAAEPILEKAAAKLEEKGMPARKMFKRAHELREIYKKRGF
ncbi:TRAP transporter substrate-binding protein [Thermodesulfobacteriota bacterium]